MFISPQGKILPLIVVIPIPPPKKTSSFCRHISVSFSPVAFLAPSARTVSLKFLKSSSPSFLPLLLKSKDNIYIFDQSYFDQTTALNQFTFSVMPLEQYWVNHSFWKINKNDGSSQYKNHNY